MHRGAEVTVVAAHTDVEPPLFVNVVPVQTAEEMYDAIVSRAQDYDFVIKAAAVADYTPAVTADNKIKKKRRRHVDPSGADEGYFEDPWGKQETGTDFVWIFHGDGKCTGEFPEEAGEQAL